MPKNYVYVPGLARDELLLKPKDNFQAFSDEVREEFGWIEIEDGSISRKTDNFTTKAIVELHTTKGAKPVACRRALRWIQLAPRDDEGRFKKGHKNSAAFKVLGAPEDNLLALEAGKRPQAPKPLAFTTALARPNITAVFLAVFHKSSKNSALLE